jgi:hypothetical protein
VDACKELANLSGIDLQIAEDKKYKKMPHQKNSSKIAITKKTKYNPTEAK